MNQSIFIVTVVFTLSDDLLLLLVRSFILVVVHLVVFIIIFLLSYLLVLVLLDIFCLHRLVQLILILIFFCRCHCHRSLLWDVLLIAVFFRIKNHSCLLRLLFRHSFFRIFCILTCLVLSSGQLFDNDIFFYF